MSDCVEHVRDPRIVLAIAARRLIPGGAVIAAPRLAGSILAALHLPRKPRPPCREANMRIVHARPTEKTLCLGNMADQLPQYPLSIVTPPTTLLFGPLPKQFANSALCVPTRETTVLAVRQ